MTLIRKTILAATLTLLLLSGALYWVAERILHRSYDQLEQRQLETDVARARQGLNFRLKTLGNTAMDWAYWDETYQYLQDRDEAYVRRNFSPSALKNIDVQVVLYLNPEGELVRALGADFEKASLVPVPEELVGMLKGQPALFRILETRDPWGGLLLLRGVPLLICARPILSTEEKGPARGLFLMGRYLDEAYANSLSQQIALEFAFRPLSGAQGDEEWGPPAARLLEGATPLVQVADGKRLAGYFTLPDVGGAPVLLGRIRTSRHIHQQGVVSLRLVLEGLFVSGGVCLLVFTLLLHGLVLRPLSRMQGEVNHIATNRDLSLRLTSGGSDELGRLSADINSMVARLQQSQTDLLRLSREAGMSEVAKGVLHNVGNVLTSIGVSVGLLREKLENFRTRQFQQVTALLRENQDRLAEFLVQDERGRLVGEYLTGLGGHLEGQRQELLDELRQLDEQVHHLKAIVGAQQEYARNVEFLEVVEPRILMEEALQIGSAPLRNAGIEIIREWAVVPPLRTARHKVLQILVNLLRNAAEALAAHPSGQPWLKVRVCAGAAERVLFEVEDNGVGILPQDLVRIFTLGFTTKLDGHGFGLHRSAVAAQELGGELRVHSEGPGKGACFTLSLPLAQKGP